MTENPCGLPDAVAAMVTGEIPWPTMKAEPLAAFVARFLEAAPSLADIIHEGAQAGVESNGEDAFSELTLAAESAMREAMGDGE